MENIICGLVLILESTVMCSMGYGINTWQWWAMILLTVLYAFILTFSYYLED